MPIENSKGEILVVARNDTHSSLYKIAKNKRVTLLLSSKQSVASLFKTSNRIYYHTDNSIYIYSKDTLEKLVSTEFEIGRFEATSEGRIVISADDNQRILEYDGERWIDYGVEIESIIDFLVASNGDLWVGTNKGLLKFPTNSIFIYPPELGMPKNTWAILEDNVGQYWFSSYRFGLHYLNKKNKIIETQDKTKVITKSEKMISNARFKKTLIS